MINNSLIVLGKSISKLSQTLNRGNGSTWPGHIALKGNKNFIKDVLSHSKIKTIIVAGTNGKTTTSGLIRTGLEKNGKKVIQNNSGANLLNGIASSLLLNTNSQGKLTQDFALFEVDENALPAVLEQITPDYLVLLNLFRDQLDRYGEINTITQKWHDAIDTLSEKTKLILNADDPQIAAIPIFLRIPEKKVLYFGLHDKKIVHTQLGDSADSISCPRCNAQLVFTEIMFSHLGNWYCKKCGLKRPKINLNKFGMYPLSGTYNKYNTHAAALLLEDLGITDEKIIAAFTDFKPSFGRQEIIKYHDRNVQLFLSKNPTSFNQSYATIKELNATTLIIVLNDRIPDGRDISWIWDTDLPEIDSFKHIFIAGDRMYDMAVRLKYEMGIQKFTDKVQTFEILKNAIDASITSTSVDETVYILPTYSAMLDARKILTGKKIL
jgi:UDP-N-acetylmuramyl tripeptide synthase